MLTEQDRHFTGNTNQSKKKKQEQNQHSEVLSRKLNQLILITLP